MSRLSWFPFYVEDFRVSTLELKTDEVGVYFTMLVLCYARGGPLPGNDEELKFMLQRQLADFHGHTYNRIVKKLLAKYFYHDDDGNWRQKRVEVELERAREFSEKQRERVTKRWVSETEKEDKSLANAPQTSRKRSANTLQTDERSLKNNDFTHTNNNTIQYNTISSNEDITSTSKASDGCAIVRQSKRFDDQLLRTTAEAWNELASSVGLATVAKLTDARKVAITRRAKELVDDFDYENPTAGFSELFSKIRGSPFLRGSESSWRCDFDWCFALSNFTKIMEGKYENRPQKVVSFRR